MDATSNTRTTDHRLLMCGLDSLYVGYYVDTVSSSLDFEELAYQKALRSEDRGLELEPLLVGSETFLLRPYGAHPYKYVLSCESWEVKLTERMLPNLYVKFSSKALWLHGYLALDLRFREWLESLRLRSTRRESVSRADWAFDFHVPNADFDADHFVSRATKDCTWRKHKGTQTIQFGTTETLVRVYDKVSEINEQGGKSWFFQLWGVSEDVWRIEVQVRGLRLKAGGIRNLDDLSCMSGDLLREILGTHTSLRAPTKDPNRSRWPIAPIWRELLASINNLPQTGLVASYDPQQDLDFRIRKVAQGVYGYLKQLAFLYAYKTGRSAADFSLEELSELLPDILEDFYFPAEWRLDLERRIRAIEVGE